MTSYSRSLHRPSIILIAIFALIKIGLHLFTNAFASYGMFRDELYYLACAEHLDYGYVDHPPLSIWVLSVSRFLLGDSLFAVRLFPALFSGISLFMVGLITRELGGKKVAIAIVCTAMLVSAINLSFGTFYSMNVIDQMLWPILLFLLIKIINTEKPAYWIYFGIILGLALLNKISALFLGAGVFVALLATPQRYWFKTKWPYIAGAISILIFFPYIIWNSQHDWAHLEFIHNASTEKYAGLSPISFWKGQLLLNNPVTIPVWVCGILYFFLHKEDKIYHFLFWIFLTVGFILTINGTSKPEYLAAIFPLLFIGGALQIEQWSVQRKWVFYVALGTLMLGIPLFPLALPILPVETYIQYSGFLGIKPENAEGKETAALPQFYADMFGWEQKAAAIAEAYHNLSPEDQKKCVIFGDNYGRCGAVDYYADKFNLPKSIGGHNNYWLWGPGSYSGELLLILSNDVGDKNELFEIVEDLGVVTCQYCMPYESNLHLYLCRDLKGEVEELWPAVKSYK